MKWETRALSAADTRLPDGYETAPWGAYAPGVLQRALIGIARGSFLHRGRMRYLMTMLIRRLGTPLDVTFQGLRYRIEGRNNLMDYGLLLHPDYNGEEIRFLRGACAEGGVAVDIGANIGLYSLPLARAVGQGGRVISIDANAAVLQRLKVNARLSGLDNITAVACAVGDSIGQVDLEIAHSDLAIVSVTPSAQGSIPLRPLRDILSDAGITRVDALKIDIEGFEDAALVPFLETAPDAMLPRRISIERGGPGGTDYQGCAAAFARKGYRLVGRTRLNSFYERS
ncbi:MAG: FkbM family methyltransferase [Paracoccaceae bacterium]